MKKRKIVCLLMAVVMTGPLLAGCAGGKETPETTADTGDAETVVNTVNPGKTEKISISMYMLPKRPTAQNPLSCSICPTTFALP